MTPIRLTVVETHPVQYLAPWFSYITKHCPTIELTVLYASRPTPTQQATGFGRPFVWDVPLLEGYRHRVVRGSRPDDRFDSDSFRGLDVPEISNALLETRPDAVLVSGWHSITQVRAILACRKRGVPLLYRGDTHLGFRPPGPRGFLWRLKTRALLRRYSGHLAVGQRSRAHLLAHGVPPTRIYASPHAVDHEFFASQAAPHLTGPGREAVRRGYGFNPDDFVVVFVGKLNRQKRLTIALRSMAKLGPSAALLVVGDGAEDGHLRDEAASLGIRVTWAGFLNQRDIPRAYSAADCLVLPSSVESWGLVVNEAMATGLPAVVSEVVGCAPDLIVPGETGETFRVDDVDDLAAALTRVRERGGRSRMAAACLAHMADHGLAQAATGLVAACESVAQARPRVIACCGGMVVVFGLERMTFEVLRVIREARGPVHCIVNEWENHRIVPRAERIGASWSIGFYNYALTRRALNPVSAVSSIWHVVQTSAGLFRDACHFRPTHVLVPEWGAVLRNAPTLALLRFVGVSVVLRLGNAPEPGPFYRRLWRWGINPFVDRFVCNSQFTRRELLAHGIPEDKVRLIYNMAPLRVERQPDVAGPKPSRIVYVGQVIPEKGLEELLEALAVLVSRGFDANLDVVGRVDGWISPSYRDFRDRVLARAVQPDLAGRVRFLGWRDNVHEVLRSAAVHCCPSQPAMREGFGLVTLEAKLAGVPSVVTPVGALPEQIEHRVDGWVCRDASPDAMAEGLAYFLASPSRQVESGLAARRSAARFSREGFESAWREVFQ